MMDPTMQVYFREAGDKATEGKQLSKGATSIPGISDRWAIPSNYQVRQIIGTGSYGSVVEAYQHDARRLVAIKRIGHLFDDLIDCKRVLREIAILSRIPNHDHVVQLYDVFVPSNATTFDEVFLVMEICDSDLKKLCRTDVTLTALHINTLLYNLLVGVHYLHSASIFHRDLKPANCLVNQDCSVKICDFGLSRAIGDDEFSLQGVPTPLGHNARSRLPQQQSLKRSLTGHVVTRWYRAPELILLQENYTEVIDVWSVGCIYAELLGMIPGTRLDDRGPLFPGSSCFPLSPDRKHKTDLKERSRHDQLNMIFNLLGTPSQADVDELEKADSRRYVQCFGTREGEGFRSRFPHADFDSIEIMRRMLKFRPRSRILVHELLHHQIFLDIRDQSKEDRAKTSLSLDFEREPDLDEALLRKYFCREIRRYHPEMSVLN